MSIEATPTPVPATPEFVDRRQGPAVTENQTVPVERRQFGNSYADLSAAGRELGEAVDRYKLVNRRRYVTYDELISVIESLGYKK
jgi:hypothetical protein